LFQQGKGFESRARQAHRTDAGGSVSDKALRNELRIIKAARRNGRKLGVHPGLTDSSVIHDRERFLERVLGIGQAA
jgi:hypothetical protein